MLRKKGSFVAQDENGQRIIIDIFVDIIDASTMDDPNAELEGLKSLRTSNGKHINYLSKGKYLLVEENKYLFSDSPDAP